MSATLYSSVATARLGPHLELRLEPRFLSRRTWISVLLGLPLGAQNPWSRGAYKFVCSSEPEKNEQLPVMDYRDCGFLRELAGCLICHRIGSGPWVTGLRVIAGESGVVLSTGISSVF